MKTFTIFGFASSFLPALLVGRVAVSQITNTPTPNSLPASTSSFSATTTSNLVPAMASCPAWIRCSERLPEFYDPNCTNGIECGCVAYNSTGYKNCVKERCPANWEAVLGEVIQGCSVLGVDLSGNTTYTGVPLPTGIFNTTGFNTSTWGTGDDDKLSRSDKIAIGIGVGFGVPTLAVGVGAWLCVRRRGAARDRGGGRGK